MKINSSSSSLGEFIGFILDLITKKEVYILYCTTTSQLMMLSSISSNTY